MRTNVRPLFWLDLEEETAYLAGEAGEEIALRWAAAVWATVEELKAQPLLGRPRPDLPQPGVRSWRVRRFTGWGIFYGVREGELVLYRVRHGAMDLPRLDFAS